MLSKEEADSIVEGLDKSIGERLHWRLDNPKWQRYRFKVPVVCNSVAGEMFLAGHANPYTWGFVFLGPSEETIRKISTPHEGHSHPDRTLAGLFHKHYHTGGKEAVWTYVPLDITWDDFNQALLDFASECRITFLYEPERLAFQGDIREG